MVSAKSLPTLILALVVLGLAAAVRLYLLGAIPPTLNPDEASIGYNAYLLLETGRDEWGRSWPLVLEAFGDQKVAGYSLMAVVSFWFFGVSDWALRLPAVLAGLGVIGLTMWWVRRWFGWREGMLLVGLLLAVSPVLIWYQRLAFEAGPALFFTLAIILLVFPSPLVAEKLLGVRQSLPKVAGSSWLAYGRRLSLTIWRSIWLRLAGLSALIVAAIFTYNSPLVLIPGILVAMPWWWGRVRWREWSLMMLVGLMVWAGSALYLTGLSEQKSQITIFGEETMVMASREYYASFDGPWRPLLGNRYLFWGREMAVRMVASLQPEFIINNQGGHPWHALAGSGYLIWSVYWLGWLGLSLLAWEVWQLLWQRRDHLIAPGLIDPLKAKSMMIYLLFLSLIPSAMTVNAPHATRTLLFFVIWNIVAVKGVLRICVFASLTGKWLASVLSFFPSWWVLQSWRGLVMVVLALALAWPSGTYLQQLLYSDQPVHRQYSVLQPGLEQALQFLEKKYPGQPLVVIDERGFYYIQFAWYLRLTPEEFENQVVRQLPDAINFRYGEALGRYRFIRQLDDRRPEEALLFWQSRPEPGWQMVPAGESISLIPD